jgi:hypothetical protein
MASRFSTAVDILQTGCVALNLLAYSSGLAFCIEEDIALACHGLPIMNKRPVGTLVANIHSADRAMINCICSSFRNIEREDTAVMHSDE